MLPDHVPAMPMPETEEEARMIVRALETGQLPSNVDGLDLSEKELAARAA